MSLAAIILSIVSVAGSQGVNLGASSKSNSSSAAAQFVTPHQPMGLYGRPNGRVIALIPALSNGKATTLKIIGEESDWGKVTATIGGGKYTGWIELDYPSEIFSSKS